MITNPSVENLIDAIQCGDYEKVQTVCYQNRHQHIANCRTIFGVSAIMLAVLLYSWGSKKEAYLNIILCLAAFGADVGDINNLYAKDKALCVRPDNPIFDRDKLIMLQPKVCRKSDFFCSDSGTNAEVFHFAPESFKKNIDGIVKLAPEELFEQEQIPNDYQVFSAKFKYYLAHSNIWGNAVFDRKRMCEKLKLPYLDDFEHGEKDILYSHNTMF